MWYIHRVEYYLAIKRMVHWYILQYAWTLKHYAKWKKIIKYMIPYIYQISMICTHLLQLGFTLCDPIDCSSPSSSVHGIIQARILEWVAIFFSRGSYWTRDQTHVSGGSYVAGRIFITETYREPNKYPR